MLTNRQPQTAHVIRFFSAYKDALPSQHRGFCLYLQGLSVFLGSRREQTYQTALYSWRDRSGCWLLNVNRDSPVELFAPESHRALNCDNVILADQGRLVKAETTLIISSEYAIDDDTMVVEVGVEYCAEFG